MKPRRGNAARALAILGAFAAGTSPATATTWASLPHFSVSALPVRGVAVAALGPLPPPVFVQRDAYFAAKNQVFRIDRVHATATSVLVVEGCGSEVAIYGTRAVFAACGTFEALKVVTAGGTTTIPLPAPRSLRPQARDTASPLSPSVWRVARGLVFAYSTSALFGYRGDDGSLCTGTVAGDESVVRAVPLDSSDDFVVQTSLGRVLRLTPSCGTRSRVLLSPGLLAPAGKDGFFVLADRRIVSYAGSRIVSSNNLTDRGAALAVDRRRDAVYVLESAPNGDNVLGVVRAGRFTESRLPISGASALVVAPDGSCWIVVPRQHLYVVLRPI
jgi:hypothetical protein